MGQFCWLIGFVRFSVVVFVCVFFIVLSFSLLDPLLFFFSSFLLFFWGGGGGGGGGEGNEGR